jgi:hypothetical protein
MAVIKKTTDVDQDAGVWEDEGRNHYAPCKLEQLWKSAPRFLKNYN